MSRELRVFTVTTPPGTLQAAPLSTPFALPPREVSRIEVTVPPGPAGLMGFAITNSGLTVIPYASTPFIITAGEFIGWDIVGYINSGAWGALTYNTDTIAHSIQVRLFCDIPGQVGATIPTVITDDEISNNTTTPDA